MRGATLCHSELSEAIEISIHAPRAGGDLLTSRALFSLGNAISIHAPRAGGDTYPRHDFRGILYFNPRPPCGGRPEAEATRSLIQAFQSTPPVRGATYTVPEDADIYDISIHAPRAGGDGRRNNPCAISKNFNPRPPCGGRHMPFLFGKQFENFNPRPPCGGRLIRGYAVRRERGISIHAPRAGGDYCNVGRYRDALISIHAPRAGGDVHILRFGICGQRFQSTPPVRGATPAGG